MFDDTEALGPPPGQGGWFSWIRDVAYGLYLQASDNNEYKHWLDVHEGRALYHSLDQARMRNALVIAEYQGSINNYSAELVMVRALIRVATDNRISLLCLDARKRDLAPHLTPSTIFGSFSPEERGLLMREKLLDMRLMKKQISLTALEEIDQGLQTNMTDACSAIEGANMALHTSRLSEITRTANKIDAAATYNSIKNNTQKILGDLTRAHGRMDDGDSRELAAPDPGDMRFFESVCAEALTQNGLPLMALTKHWWACLLATLSTSLLLMLANVRDWLWTFPVIWMYSLARMEFEPLAVLPEFAEVCDFVMALCLVTAWMRPSTQHFALLCWLLCAVPSRTKSWPDFLLASVLCVIAMLTVRGRPFPVVVMAATPIVAAWGPSTLGLTLTLVWVAFLAEVQVPGAQSGIVFD